VPAGRGQDICVPTPWAGTILGPHGLPLQRDHVRLARRRLLRHR
jgi:hypothetical protein